MSENNVLVVEAEEIPIEQAVEKTLLTELEKLEITKKALEEKRDHCLTLKLNGQDKEAYTVIRETRLNMKTNRVVIEKICKKKREDATRTQKAWIALEKDWTKIVSEGEDYCQKLEDEFESEKARIEAEKKRRMDEQFILRQAELTKMGAQYIDGSFVLGSISYEAVLVKECDEDIWHKTIKHNFNLQYIANREKELFEQKKKADEEAALKQQAEAQERRQKELEQREAAIKKAEEDQAQKEKIEHERQVLEMKRKQQEIIANRGNQLRALGMEYILTQESYLFEDVNVHWTEISVMNEQEWVALIEKITPIIEQRKQKAEEKRLAEIEEQKRIAAEEATKKERERFAEEQRQIEIKKQQEEEKKVEELAQAGDKDKWIDFLVQLKKLSIPEMKSGPYRRKIGIAKEKLEEITES